MNETITLPRSVVEQALLSLRIDDLSLVRESVAALHAALEQPQPDTGIPASVPPGWKLVPVEPVSPMLTQAQMHSEIGAYIAANWAGAYDCFKEFYRAMLAAAPQPPVVEPHSCTYQGGYLDGMAKGRRDAELDALETNPVAWILRDSNNRNVKFLEWTSAPLGYRGEWIKTPLYTHPQPRQPLTTEMADLGWELHGSSDAYQAWYLAIEWTERTHGIGGEA